MTVADGALQFVAREQPLFGGQALEADAEGRVMAISDRSISRYTVYRDGQAIGSMEDVHSVALAAGDNGLWGLSWRGVVTRFSREWKPLWQQPLPEGGSLAAWPDPDPRVVVTWVTADGSGPFRVLGADGKELFRGEGSVTPVRGVCCWCATPGANRTS